MQSFDKNFVGPVHQAGAIVAKRGVGKVHPYAMQQIVRGDGTISRWWHPMCSCPGTANGSAKPHTFYHFSNVNCGN